MKWVIEGAQRRWGRAAAARADSAWSTKTDFNATYRRLVKRLSGSHPTATALEMAVGGHFEPMGLVERATLIHHGLRADDYLIDVGCGSGRLAKPLAEYLSGKYLGIDVVPDLLDEARRRVHRSDWRFELTNGTTIPEGPDTADMVCFFSVFTHLLHEESYAYLREAKRVLRPGGKIVFSFLDFQIPQHWSIFEFNVRDIGIGSHPLNMFMGQDMIRVWAARLELEVEGIHNGDSAYVPVPEPVVFDNGTVMKDLATLGQSVCVLIRP